MFSDPTKIKAAIKTAEEDLKSVAAAHFLKDYMDAAKDLAKFMVTGEIDPVHRPDRHLRRC